MRRTPLARSRDVTKICAFLPGKVTAKFSCANSKRMKSEGLETSASLLIRQKTRATFASEVQSLPHVFATLQPGSAQ
jgi:hypothetical protein